MTSSLTKGILVAMIGEAVLQEKLIHLLSQIKVSGYTIVSAKKAGSYGRALVR